jgi:predicted RNA-binding protein YlqC (UPF0109 family)
MQEMNARSETASAFAGGQPPCPGDPCLSTLSLVQSMVQAIVSRKEGVKVTCRPDGRGRTIVLTVALEDLRTLVGNQSRMAESLRTIVQSIGMRHGQRLSLRIDAAGKETGILATAAD